MFLALSKPCFRRTPASHPMRAVIRTVGLIKKTSTNKPPSLIGAYSEQSSPCHDMATFTKAHDGHGFLAYGQDARATRSPGEPVCAVGISVVSGVPATPLPENGKALITSVAMENKSASSSTPNVNLLCATTFSDDALLVAASARRTHACVRGLHTTSTLGTVRDSKRRRVASLRPDTTAKTQGGPSSALSQAHSARRSITFQKESTAARAIRARHDLSTRPISEGGLGPYFLAEVFRRADLEAAISRTDVPVSSHVIATLPLKDCDDPNASCSICLQDLSVETVMLPCAHCFHKKCIVPWLQLHNSCPCCRGRLESHEPAISHCTLQASDCGLHSRLRLERGKVASEIALRACQWDGMNVSTLRTLMSKSTSLVGGVKQLKRKHAEMKEMLGH